MAALQWSPMASLNVVAFVTITRAMAAPSTMSHIAVERQNMTTMTTMSTALFVDVVTTATKLSRTQQQQLLHNQYIHQHRGEHVRESAVSPVTLSSDWSRVARLLLLAGLAVVGSIGNVFMISAVMIEDQLKKRGNTFIVNVALADLLITGCVIPASAVAILAGLDSSLTVCKFQWFLAVVCFLITVLSLASTAIENHARLCGSEAFYEKLTNTKITVIVLTYWAISTILSAVQFVYNISIDYCTRKNAGLLPYQSTIIVITLFLTILLTFVFYLCINYKVHVAKSRPTFKPPIAFTWDYSLMKTNMYSFILFVLFWLPFGIVLSIGSIQTIPDGLFYHLAWFALIKSVINSFLYCVCNRHFRNAYANLFQYCCCKTTVTFSRRTRGEGTRPTGDVRVHIIPGYNMYSYTSPQRGGGGGREPGATKRTGGHHGAGRPSTSRSKSREIYEL